MRRLARLTTMVSLMLLGLFLLASDSMGSAFLMNNESTILDYNGDLIISGTIEARDNDSDVIDVKSSNIRINVRVYDDNGEIFSRENHSFTFKSNILTVVLKDEDIHILENNSSMNYNIELDLSYDDGDDEYGSIKSIYFEYKPRKDI